MEILSLEERRKAAKKKLEEAKERVEERQHSGGRSVLAREAPIRREEVAEKPLSAKEKARLLAEKAAAEKAERLKAQRLAREESSIAAMRSPKEKLLKAAEKAEATLDRAALVQQKLEAAAESQNSKRLKEAIYNKEVDGGVERLSKNSALNADNPELAHKYEYLQKRWAEPAVKNAYLTISAKLELKLGKWTDSVVRSVGYGAVAQHYSNGAEALDAINSYIGYPLGSLFDLSLPDLEIDAEGGKMVLQSAEFDEYSPEFTEDFAIMKIALGATQISSLAFEYLKAVFMQLLLNAIGAERRGEEFAPAEISFPPELTNLFYENITTCYIARHESPALFELQPINLFIDRFARFIRFRGWGQH